MSKLSDTVERKFVDTIDVSDWEVETEEGWADINSVSKTVPYEVFFLETETGKSIKCADDHILFDENGKEIFAKDSLNKKILTKDGQKELVTGFYSLNYNEQMYDIEVDSNNHSYYSNDILSHNSVSTAVFVLWEILFNSHHTAAILANKAETAREILNSKLKASYEGLPLWLQQGVKKWNEGSIVLENGSRVLTAATSSSAIRGYSLNTLFLDEVAHIEPNKFHEFFDSVYPTIAAGRNSKLIMVSTPKGLNHWYSIFNNAKNNRNEFAWMEITWRSVPGRDEEWARKEKENMNERRFAQEHEVDFLGSSNTLITPDNIKNLTPSIPLKADKEETYRIYEMPQDNHVYIMSCDVSRGKGLDNSAFNIIDVTEYPFKQVVSFSSNSLSPFAYTEIIWQFAQKYNEAFVLVENNEIGGQVAHDLNYDMEYENIISASESSRSGELGVRTTKTTKRKGAATFKELVENSKLIIQDSETIKEISGFIAKNNSYEADKGFSDDLIMSLVVFSWFVTQELFNDLTDKDVRQKLRDQSLSEEEMAPITGFFDDGTEENVDEEFFVGF